MVPALAWSYFSTVCYKHIEEDSDDMYDPASRQERLIGFSASSPQPKKRYPWQPLGPPPSPPMQKREFLDYFKVLYALRAQRIWTLVIQEAGMLPADVSQLQWKAPRILMWAEPVAAKSPSPFCWVIVRVGGSPPACSVSGLVEQDVSGLWVLGDVRRQTVELLDRLRVDFLREKRT